MTDPLRRRSEELRAELLAMADDHHHPFWEMSSESQLVYVVSALASHDGIEPAFDELEAAMSDPAIGEQATTLLRDIHDGR